MCTERELFKLNLKIIIRRLCMDLLPFNLQYVLFRERKWKQNSADVLYMGKCLLSSCDTVGPEAGGPNPVLSKLGLNYILIPWVRPSFNCSTSLGANVREQLQILIHIIAECCLFSKEVMAVHLAGEHGVYLFLSGPTEGFGW